MKTVLVKSLKMSGGGNTYDLSSMNLTMSVGQVPDCSVTVITGYNLYTKKTMEFSDSGKETVYTIDIETGDGTTTLFKGYIQSVGKASGSNPVNGSSATTSVTLTGVQSKLMKYGGSNYSYYSTTGTPQETTPSGCADIVVGDNPKSDKLVDATNPFTSMRSCILDTLQITYGYCIGDKPQVRKDLDAIIKDPLNIRLSPDFNKANKEELIQTRVTDALESLTMDRFAGANMLEVLFATVSSDLFMLQLVPRLETMEILPVLPWFKKEQITVDKSGLINIQMNTVLKNIRRKPDMIAVILTNSNSSTGNDPTGYLGVTYPLSSEEGSKSGGAVQKITMPEWLVGVEDVDVSANKDVQGDVRVQDQADKKDGTVPDVNMAQLFAKAYFGSVYNNDTSLSLVVPWYQFSLLFQTGYVIRVKGIETVPENGVGTFFGRLSSVVLTINGSPSSASCAMRLVVNNIRSEEQNSQFGLEEHPLYKTGPAEGSGAANQMVGTAAGQSGNSGVGPKSITIDTGAYAQESSIPGFSASDLANASTSNLVESKGGEIKNDQSSGVNSNYSKFVSTYAPTGMKNAQMG
jgi:hypothetical protein